MGDRFYENCIVKHFKRELDSKGFAYVYQYNGIVKHSETKEELVLYTAMYPDKTGKHEGDMFVRPRAMFESEVDNNKYPEIEQLFRFEVVDKPCCYCDHAYRDDNGIAHCNKHGDIPVEVTCPDWNTMFSF